MIALRHCLCVALVFACPCISRCNSQLECVAMDGEITYPDRCEHGRTKDLCRRGQYLKVSSVLCNEENGSDDDRCLNCEAETYMPYYNFCTECWITTQCKDNEEESRAPTSTTDRECRPKPITAPPVTPDCPVCECSTQNSCPPCPTAADLSTDSHTSGQETSDGSTTVMSTAANGTNLPLDTKGDKDYWKWIACGLGGLVVVAFLVIAILVCILCRTRRGRKQGVCPRCKRKCDNGGYEMKDRNPQDGCGRYEDEVHPQIEMGVRNSQDRGGLELVEAHEGNEMASRNPQNTPGAIEPDEGSVNEVHPEVPSHNDRGKSSRSKDEALHSNLVPTGVHLDPGKSSENRTIQPAIKSPSILTNDESGSFDTSRNTPNTPNTPNTQPLLSNRREINSSPPLRHANGTKCFQYKELPKPSESSQPLLSNSISGFETNSLHSEKARRNDASSLPPSRYDSSCILEADESTEKPCERTTICEECHINLVKDEIDINSRGKLFDALNINKKKRDELFHDNLYYGIREQIRAVLHWWLQANEKQSIVKLFLALEESGNADVINMFKKKFNVKQIESTVILPTC